MSRAAMLSFGVATLFAFAGCEKKDTNVPEDPMEKADNAPSEEDEDQAEGTEEDEEEAPNLSKRSPFSA